MGSRAGLIARVPLLGFAAGAFAAHGVAACSGSGAAAQPDASVVGKPGAGGGSAGAAAVSSGGVGGAPSALRDGGVHGDCTPFAPSGCSSGETCVRAKLDNSYGNCEAAGTIAEGQPCSTLDPFVPGGCKTGLLCSLEYPNPRVCRSICNVFSSDPGCPSGQACDFHGVCDALPGDRAQIDEPCSDRGVCANDGRAFRGTCSPTATGWICARNCRLNVASDCPAGKHCDEYVNEGMGFCL